MAKSKVVFDTNGAIALINGVHLGADLQRLIDVSERYVSIVNRIELYAKPDITSKEEHKIDDFLTDLVVITLNDAVERVTIRLRKEHSSIKLPDAIVAATAIVLGAVLITDDIRLLKLTYPGFTAQAIS